MELYPKEFSLEATSVWSFPKRGKWATHSADYRGNWSPYIPRNLILRYSVSGELVLDQFVGSGTTLVEARLLNRSAIGVDINPKAVLLSSERLRFPCIRNSKIVVKRGDAQNLDFIKDDTIDFICMHPPYADIIRYSADLEGDISLLPFNSFLNKIENVAKESFRVLKKRKMCAIMIGDIRKKGSVLPLGFRTMERFFKVGFSLKEIIIKEQHNCRRTPNWIDKNIDFLLLAHEYIFVFQK